MKRVTRLYIKIKSASRIFHTYKQARQAGIKLIITLRATLEISAKCKISSILIQFDNFSKLVVLRAFD